MCRQSMPEAGSSAAVRSANKMKTFVLATTLLLLNSSYIVAQSPRSDPVGPVKEVVAKATKATVVVRTPTGHGTGFIIGTNGTLITNYHVIEGDSQARIEFHDGRVLPVLSVLTYSPKMDLALLRIAPGNYECLEIEPPENISMGDDLFIIGHPHGHNWTLTKGYLAGKRITRERPVIQFSADISPGNSGGPVMNMEGKVIGVATYYRIEELKFQDDMYVMDPSTVLKFGIASDAFINITNFNARKQHTLAEVAAYGKRLTAINTMSAILAESHELLRDLHSGIAALKVEVDRKHDYTYRNISGNYRVIGTETIIFNHDRFVNSSVRLELLARFRNQEVPDATGDINIDNCVRNWRDSMNAAIRSIYHVVSADGASEINAKARVAAVRREFNYSSKAMYEALNSAEIALRSYSTQIRNPYTDFKQISDLRQFYYGNGLSF